MDAKPINAFMYNFSCLSYPDLRYCLSGLVGVDEQLPSEALEAANMTISRIILLFKQKIGIV